MSRAGIRNAAGLTMVSFRKRVRPRDSLTWALPLCTARNLERESTRAVAPPHAPVLVEPIVANFAGRRMRVFVDGTLGAGGHAAAILDACSIDRYIGIDKDVSALALARERLLGHEGVELINADFRELGEVLRNARVNPGDVGGILLDVGVSSMQLDSPERGFSFMRDGPLDMRMSTGPCASGPTAADFVNKLSEDELVHVFRSYGEEPHARLMADRIIRARTLDGPITTTLQLAEVLSAGKRKSGRGIHPATLCFQALRIVVNGELDALREVLPEAVKTLEPGTGRLAVVSFHSLEDRIVKYSFRDLSKEQGGVRILTKKPIIASAVESRENARSRSAKLRIVERLGLDEFPRIGKVNKYRPDT